MLSPHEDKSFEFFLGTSFDLSCMSSANRFSVLLLSQVEGTTEEVVGAVTNLVVVDLLSPTAVQPSC